MLVCPQQQQQEKQQQQQQQHQQQQQQLQMPVNQQHNAFCSKCAVEKQRADQLTQQVTFLQTIIDRFQFMHRTPPQLNLISSPEPCLLNSLTPSNSDHIRLLCAASISEPQQPPAVNSSSKNAVDWLDLLPNPSSVVNDGNQRILSAADLFGPINVESWKAMLLRLPFCEKNPHNINEDARSDVYFQEMKLKTYIKYAEELDSFTVLSSDMKMGWHEESSMRQSVQ
ncbi:hypothetical protein HK100_004613 [Physocladia obscura]|uniref:Uncharacterized protein n=1 Tax=Physocladia obscura TaxID=109957 RepID=A0AAD5SU96_9FUNG|nr:hypothetical protein HK100_004613 [Physocladia obscura]